MRSIRNVIFWTHLVCGLTAGIIIFIMCVTGALLAFEKDTIAFAERDNRVVDAPYEAQTKPVSAIIGAAKQFRPDSKPSSLLITNDPTAAVMVALGREGQVFVDPYTGEIKGEGAGGVRSFFRTMTDLHRYIAMSGDGRPVGRAITGAGNLVFLFLAISGLYIWMPRRLEWRSVRPVLWFRAGTSGKARDFNWHNTIGFWCSAVLVVLTLTATVISYQWASNLVYTLTGNQPPPPANANATQAPAQPAETTANIDSLWDTARSQSPTWKTISLRLPVAKDAVFTIDEGTSWNIFGRSTLTLDAASGTVAKWEPYSGQNSGRQLRSWMRFTHTGETGGPIGQFIALVACLGGAFLVYTGFALALRRFGNWRKRKRNAVVV